MDEWIGFDFFSQQPSKELLRSVAAKKNSEVKIKTKELITVSIVCIWFI